MIFSDKFVTVFFGHLGDILNPPLNIESPTLVNAKFYFISLSGGKVDFFPTGEVFHRKICTLESMIADLKSNNYDSWFLSGSED